MKCKKSPKGEEKFLCPKLMTLFPSKFVVIVSLKLDFV